jgi:hypothetical protein
MRYDLVQITRRARPTLRRRAIVIRDIAPPAVLATDLYRACYAPVVAIWERAVEPIVAEYERTLASVTTDAPPTSNPASTPQRRIRSSVPYLAGRA